MSYDNVIILTGGFGKYQRKLCFWLFLPPVFYAFHTMVGVFLTASPNVRCLLPFEDTTNATYELPESIMNLFYPYDNSSGSWSQCERYDLNYTDQYPDVGGDLSLTNSTVTCDSYVYDQTTYKLSTTTEFNFVCDKEWVTAMGNSLYMVGVMIGAMTIGTISDKFGRKPALCLALGWNLVTGFLVAASPESISFIIFRLMLGVSLNAMYLVIFVIGIELVVPENRMLMGVSIQGSITFGFIILTVFAYFIRNWRILQIAITIPSFICILYWWFIPESVRWLLRKNRISEAKESIMKIASVNGVKVSPKMLDDEMDNLTGEKEPSDLEKPSLFDMMKYPNLRKRSLLLFIMWCVNGSTYYGLSWNTSSFAGNDYVNFAIAGLVEVPAHVFVFLTMNRFGRRIILRGCFLFAAASLLLIMVVPSNLSWLTIVLAMIGKSTVTASFEIIYVFTAEQYPTVIRNAAVGACSTCARIGTVIAPYIIYSSSIWTPLPYALFGGGALIAGLATLLLPETLNEKLPETIQDGENFGKYVHSMVYT